MRQVKLYVTFVIVAFIALFMSSSVVTNAADTVEFPVAVEKKTEAPEGYVTVTTAEELLAIASQADGNYILMNDIDLSALETFSGLAEFSGILDGNGYAVKGLKVPLISCMKGGSILNLALTDVNISADGAVGALVSSLGAEGTQACEISNVYVTGTVSGTAAAGGLIGRDILGKNVIESVANYASIHSNGGAGGIVGEKSDGAVSSYINCSNSGSVVSTGNGAGGIAGLVQNVDAEMLISACCNTGSVTAANEAGGIVGYLVCRSGTAASSASLEKLSNSGTVKATSKLGGVAGSLYLEDDAVSVDAVVCVTESSNVGVMDSVSSYSGGIAGYIDIQKAASSARAVIIENCLNLGMMKDGGNIAGEIAAASGGVSISKCIGIQKYNSATEGILERITIVNGGTTGICTLTDCYYFSTDGTYAYASGSNISGTASSLNETQIKTGASFKNFDFTNTWGLDAAKNEGYPYLKNATLLPIPYKAPAVNTVLEDTSSAATYRVTAEGREVAYVGTSNTSATVLTIPSQVTIDGFSYRVTSIAKRAFMNNKVVTRVTIPETVTSLEQGAFYACSSLKTVKGGTGITHIYQNVFRKCKRLSTLGATSNRITLPAIQYIGKRVFRDCVSIKKVYIPSPDLTTIRQGAFWKCTSMTKFNSLSKELSKIEKYAFGRAGKLKTIIFHTSLLTSSNVGSNAFKSIYSKAVFKVPSAKVSAYQTIFWSKGAGSRTSVRAV